MHRVEKDFWWGNTEENFSTMIYASKNTKKLRVFFFAKKKM